MNGNGKGKTVALAAILIAFLCLALFFVWRSGQSNIESNNGSGTTQVVQGSADGFKGKVNATVTVKDGKIIDIKLSGLDETPEIGGAALVTLSEEIIKKGTTNGIDVVSGATYSSKAAFSAISDAMSKLEAR